LENDETLRELTLLGIDYAQGTASPIRGELVERTAPRVCKIGKKGGCLAIRRFLAVSPIGGRFRAGRVCRDTTQHRSERKTHRAGSYLYGRSTRSAGLETGLGWPSDMGFVIKLRERRDRTRSGSPRTTRSGDQDRAFECTLAEFIYTNPTGRSDQTAAPEKLMRDARFMRQGLLSRDFYGGNDDHDHRQNHIAELEHQER